MWWSGVGCGGVGRGDGWSGVGWGGKGWSGVEWLHCDRLSQPARVVMVLSPVWTHDQIQLFMVKRLLIIRTGPIFLWGKGPDKYKGAKSAACSVKPDCGPYFRINSP